MKRRSWKVEIVVLLNANIIKVVPVTLDGKELGLQGQFLLLSPFVFRDRPKLFESLVMLVALLLLPYEFVLGQFFKQFRLDEISHEVRINLRHDGRENYEIGINRPSPVPVRDGSLE